MNKLRLANLKLAMAYLSGTDLKDVKIHYDSPYPAKFQACAYAQRDHIYIGPGQEQYLPHELWHVVQQKQGRVLPTIQIAGYDVNANPVLEQEATKMGAIALMISNMPDFMASLPEVRSSCSTDFEYRNSTPVIQFTLEHAKAYVQEHSLNPGNETINLDWINRYISSDNDEVQRIGLINAYHKAPTPLQIPEDLQHLVVQKVTSPTIINTANWLELQQQAQNLNTRPSLGLAGKVPNIFVQTSIRKRLDNGTPILPDPVFTQLSPSDKNGDNIDNNIDVQSTAFPNEPHTHRNMAAKTQLSNNTQDVNNGVSNTVKISQNAARNIMRLVKGTAIVGSGTDKKKGLVPVSTTKEENNKAWDVSVAFAIELGIAETRHGGAAALAQAMAVLYILKHGKDIRWVDGFYGTGDGGGKKLGNLRNNDEETREDALIEAYENLAKHLLEIYEGKFSKNAKSSDHLKKWLINKFKSWTARYNVGDFDPGLEVDRLVKMIAGINQQYGQNTVPERRSTRDVATVNYEENSSEAESESSSNEGGSTKRNTNNSRKRSRDSTNHIEGNNSDADESEPSSSENSPARKRPRTGGDTNATDANISSTGATKTSKATKKKRSSGNRSRKR